MRGVSIIGAGLTKFGEHWDRSFRDLIAEAGIKALGDSGLEGKDVQAIYGGCMASGRFIAQEHIGALIADQLGLNPVPATRVEAACASGGVALRNAYLAVASGACDVVAVGGIEKMTEVGTEEAAVALGGAGDQETELFHGASFPALYALMARAHMKEFGTTETQMAMCSVKSHANAMHNEYAQYRKEITVEDVLKSSPVATPLKLLDCSPITDGAAAVILAANEVAKKACKQPVEIVASAQSSDTLAIAGRDSLTELKATKVAGRDACKAAGIKPGDVDLAEVHDCFSIAEVLAIEDLGFFPKGEGGKATERGDTKIGGKVAINTSGGLKSAGHPVGATGIKQAVEIYWQLRNEAGGRQVKGAKIGMSHNVGGSGATAVVHIYRRLE